MEKRVENLEELSELLTRQLVDYNKNLIQINQNLIHEIRSLREAYSKQDEDFQDLKNLLRKIYEQNRSLSILPTFQTAPGAPNMPPPPPLYAPPPPQSATAAAAANVMPPHQAMLNHPPPQHLHQQQQQQHMLPPQLAPFVINQQHQPPPNMMPPQQHQQQQQQQVFMDNNNPLSKLQSMTNQVNQQQAAAPFSFNKMAQPQPQQQQQQQQTPPAKPVVQPQQQQQQQVETKSFFTFGGATATVTTTTSSPQQQQQQENKKPPLFQFGYNPSSLSPASTQQQQQQQQQQAKPTISFSPQKPTTQQQQPPASSQPPSIFGANNSSTSPGKFSFGLNSNGSNNDKQLTPTKPVTTTTPAASKLGFNLGGGASTGSPFATVSFNSPKLGGANDEDEGDDQQNPEEYEPQVDFKPIVKLQEVEVKTGEEDEDVCIKQRCKLYRFDTDTKEWKEKGVGDIKILKHKETGIYRILMRREQVLKLCANHRIKSDFKLKEIAPKRLSWMAVDFSDNKESSELLMASFRTPEEANQFRKEFENAVTQTSKAPAQPAQKTNTTTTATTSDKPSLNQLFKSTGWNCTACYAPNKAESDKCACCQTLKDGSKPAASQSATTILPPSTTAQSSSPGKFSFGAPPPQAGAGAKPPFSFGAPSPASASTTTSAASSTSKLDFSAKANAPNNMPTSTSLFSNLSANNTKPSFSFGSNNLSFGSDNKENAAANNSSQPLFKSFSAISILPNQSANDSLLKSSGAAADGDEDGDDQQNPEEYEPQVDFKPIVKLQEVEVKTGEENEEAMFKERCKLYRYDNNEWKEKGVGEMKVLRHKTNDNMFRILMRRDQVLKLCANHRITSDLKFEIFNEKQVRWHAQDYSEGEGKHETLAARFRSEKEAKAFVAECEKAKKAVEADNSTGNKPPSKPAEPKQEVKKTTQAAGAAGDKPSLNQLFKNNGWNCTGCYATNKAESDKCACCQTGRDGSKPSAATTTTNLFNPSASSGGASLFGKPTSNAPVVFGAKETVSFADMAKNSTQSGFGGGFTNKASNPASFALFGSKPAQPLFGGAANTTNNDEDGDGDDQQNPEEYEPQVDFKPLVQLEKVDVKTGEEDENVLFKVRCKAFRFHTDLKEWKEKGVGEVKILEHKEKKHSYRVLMRRDQVLKLCANFKLSKDLKLENINEKQLRVLVHDCSEHAEPQAELLAFKFRGEDEAKQFRSVFESVQKVLSGDASAAIRSSTSTTASTTASNNGEVEVVKEVKASKEQIERARKLQLPDNFYLYENREPCKGCRGCHEE